MQPELPDDADPRQVFVLHVTGRGVVAEGCWTGLLPGGVCNRAAHRFGQGLIAHKRRPLAAGSYERTVVHDAIKEEFPARPPPVCGRR